MKKKILIIGNSAKEYSLARTLAGGNEVFVAPGNDAISEFATCIDLRENDVSGILEFVLENGIDLTIPASRRALETNITELFNANNQPIFAPNLETIKFLYDKALMKKILYKLRIPTPKFGIFEKPNIAYDYIKNLSLPFVIKTNETSSSVIVTSVNIAKNIMDTIFAKKYQTMIVEDYVWGTPFTFYAITDGYKALPITSTITYHYSLDGDGGQLSSGMGTCSPNYKLSISNENYLIENVIYPIIEYAEQEGCSYTGILGVTGIITENNQIQVLGLLPFFQDCDCTSVLSSVDMNIVDLFESCVFGSFSDEVDQINLSDRASVSVVLKCSHKNNAENTIKGLENVDDSIMVDFYSSVKKNKYLEYEANEGENIVITATTKTLSSSSKKVYEEVNNINYKGITYRKDICKS